MNSKFRVLVLAAMATLFLFSSCKKSNKQGRYIPARASFVMHLNGESLLSKLPWEEVKQNEAFKKVYADTSTPAYIKAALDNPENTGIDIKNDIIIFAQKDSAGDYAGIQGTVKDADKFKTFTSNAHREAAHSEKDGIHYLSDKKMSAGWNKDRFIILFNSAGHMKGFKMPGDSMMMPEPEPEPVINRDLSPVVASLFALTEDASLAKDERFTSLMNSKGDLHFWVNTQSLYEGITMPVPVDMGKLYDGSMVTGTASFDDGQINAEVRSYGSKELTELFKKYGGTTVNTDMIKRIPSKDIGVLVAMNFKPEGIREFVKIMGLEGFANMGATMLGFTLDDLIKAIKGDILFSVSNVKQDSTGKPGATILFSSSVNDKASFEKILNAGKKMGQERLGDSMPSSIAYSSTPEWFAIGNDKAVVDGYIAGKANTSYPFMEKISGSPIVVYLDFQYLMNAFKGSAVKDTSSVAMFNASLAMWENMIASGGNFKDGSVNQHVEVNLVDKKTNSLKQLNNYISKMASLSDKRKTMTQNIPIPDSTATN